MTTARSITLLVHMPEGLANRLHAYRKRLGRASYSELIVSAVRHMLDIGETAARASIPLPDGHFRIDAHQRETAIEAACRHSRKPGHIVDLHLGEDYTGWTQCRKCDYGVEMT